MIGSLGSELLNSKSYPIATSIKYKKNMYTVQATLISLHSNISYEHLSLSTICIYFLMYTYKTRLIIITIMSQTSMTCFIPLLTSFRPISTDIFVTKSWNWTLISSSHNYELFQHLKENINRILKVIPSFQVFIHISHTQLIQVNAPIFFMSFFSWFSASLCYKLLSFQSWKFKK